MASNQLVFTPEPVIFTFHTLAGQASLCNPKPPLYPNLPFLTMLELTKHFVPFFEQIPYSASLCLRTVNVLDSGFYFLPSFCR